MALSIINTFMRNGVVLLVNYSVVQSFFFVIKGRMFGISSTDAIEIDTVALLS